MGMIDGSTSTILLNPAPLDVPKTPEINFAIALLYEEKREGQYLEG